MQTTAFDIGELLDEAKLLLLAASLDGARTALLIGKLRTCANQAGGDVIGPKLRDVADTLERRLLAA